MTLSNDKPIRTISDEDFRAIVCNITSIQPNDPIFERINEQDKRVIKSSSRAIDMIKAIRDIQRNK